MAIAKEKPSGKQFVLLLGLVVILVGAADRVVRADSPQDFYHINPGTVPIIITAPHGGGSFPSDVSPRDCNQNGGVCLNDQNTHRIAAALTNNLELLIGERPYQVINLIDRLYIDHNRSNSANPNGANQAYEDADARPYYEYYHDAIRESVDSVLQEFGRGLLIDVHGQSSYPNTIIRGTRNGQTVTQLLDTHGEAALIGPYSVFGRMEQLGYPVTPPNLPLLEERETIYNGGHTVATYGSHRTQGIDSIQIEFSREFRTTPDNPNVWQQSAADLAESIKVFYDNYLADPSLPGDFNEDGAVDSSDYAVWREGLGVEYNQQDFFVWRDNYGAVAQGSGSAATPEPAALLLVATGGLAAVGRRSRAG